MSKRAEEAAMEAYNDMFHNPAKMSVRSTVSEEEAAQFDYKEPFKAFFLDVFQQGYEQAEKDLVLTWEDIQRIVEFADDILLDPQRPRRLSTTKEAYYTEVLKRFKEERK